MRGLKQRKYIRRNLTTAEHRCCIDHPSPPPNLRKSSESLKNEVAFLSLGLKLLRAGSRIYENLRIGLKQQLVPLSFSMSSLKHDLLVASKLAYSYLASSNR